MTPVSDHSDMESFEKTLIKEQSTIFEVGFRGTTTSGNIAEALLKDKLLGSVNCKEIGIAPGRINPYGETGNALDEKVREWAREKNASPRRQLLYKQFDLIVYTGKPRELQGYVIPRPENVLGVIEVKNSLDAKGLNEIANDLKAIRDNLDEWNNSIEIFLVCYVYNEKGDEPDKAREILRSRGIRNSYAAVFSTQCYENCDNSQHDHYDGKYILVRVHYGEFNSLVDEIQRLAPSRTV